MNYRHHYHAGNYADVFKHVLLMQLLRAMQRKDKGFLYLDTHAGRGGYDLSTTTVLPDGRERAPEYPAGIGRLWTAENLPADLADYVALVRRFNERNGALASAEASEGTVGPELKFYPGSPWVAKLLLRAQDRMALCELRPDDAEALDFEFAREERVRVQVLDGYTGLKALLPPPEKRALVLIDPPFESKAEFTAVLRGLGEVLRRMPSAVCAVWYPITERARVEEFYHGYLGLVATAKLAVGLPPTFFAELAVAGESSAVRMKGCGLLILNPPWKIDAEIRAVLPALGKLLQAEAGGGTHSAWLVPEK